MKKTFLIPFFCGLISIAFSQDPTYRQKLYYTCKVWGMVKYYHSRVSVGMVNWDTALVHTLPLIKNSLSANDFNDALGTLLAAAGPMAIATSPSPDTLPAELKRNLNFSWTHDPLLRSDIRQELDTIKENFRPHSISWVMLNTLPYYTGYLNFPYDDPMLFYNAFTNYPDEFTRLLVLFKYWNIINYFNPYNYVLDKTWDSTLYDQVIPIATAANYKDFYLTFKKICASLDDAHVEGLTYSMSFPFFNYGLPLVLRHAEDQYVVVKSGLNDVEPGDIIVSVDSLPVKLLEDSLRPCISAGNPAVLGRFMSLKILGGDFGLPTSIIYKDSSGNERTYSGIRDCNIYTWYYDYYPCDSLANAKWKKWACNIGYLNLANITDQDTDTLYNDLKNTTAIIVDNRKPGNDNALMAENLADLMAPDTIQFAKCLLPTLDYPGTYHWGWQHIGNHGNAASYPGKVIILCNQETQSGMELGCMTLKALPNSVVVGGQTAGTDGVITKFHLSEEIHTGYTSLGIFYPNGDSTQRIGIVPDSLVKLTVAGIRQGRDEILEKALQTAGCLVPFLSVTPENQNVSSSAGTAYFILTCNTNWSVESDIDWCTVTSSGSGNDTIFVSFSENATHQERIAHVRISASGLPDHIVTVTQAKSTIGIGEYKNSSYKIYPNPAKGSFEIMQANNENSPIEVSINDITDKTVQVNQLKNSSVHRIDVSSLIPGWYYVIINDGRSLSVHKLILME